MKIITQVIVCGLFFGGCQKKESLIDNQYTNCITVANIEGEYSCTGECIVIGDNGERALVKVTGEIDRIQRFPSSQTNLFQNDITGSNNFHEIEIGALEGMTMRTATAAVSDGQFPVLEEYVFQTDESCNAIGFTKIVRNPNPQYFKTCVIYCLKKS